MKKLLLFIGIAIAHCAYAQKFMQTGKIVDSPTEQYTQQRGLGHSVALSSNDIITGTSGALLKQLVFGDPRVSPAYIAPIDNIQTTQRVDRNRGAYIYSTGFGFSASIEGNVALVGEPHYFADGTPNLVTGAAVVFEKNSGNWTFKQRLIGSGLSTQSAFGAATAINGNTLFVGLNKYESGGSGNGAVYIYEKDINGVYQEIQILTPDNIAFSQPGTFGSKISSFGDYLFVSSYVKAYVFKKNNLGVWTKTQIIDLSAIPGNSSTPYLHSVSASGNFLVIGNTLVNTDANNQNSIASGDVGAAFIFENVNDTWVFKQKIVAADRNAYNYFGSSSSIDGDVLAIGAYGNSFDDKAANNLSAAGAVYIFKRNTNTGIWEQSQKIIANDRESGAYFGWSVSLKGNNLAVGATRASSDIRGIRNGNTQYFIGSAYLFKNISSSGLPETAQVASYAMGALSNFEVLDASNLPILALGTNGSVPITNNLTTVKVWKESSAQLNAGTLYLPRHYEITPTSNASTSTATVTLYFSQQEFLDYNSNPSKTADFPINASDTQGISNIRITKIGGSSNNGTGLINTYSGSTTFIDPDNDKIVWNASASRWEITFNVTGFSGFFASATPTTLPLTLTLLTAKKNNSANLLVWETKSEINTSHFEVERSLINNNEFQKIGEVNALGSGAHNYTFEDKLFNQTGNYNYYRLKMVDKNGDFTYSKVVAVKNVLQSVVQVKLYPNPATNYLRFEINDSSLLDTKIDIINALGKTVLSEKIMNETFTLNIESLQSGVYFVQFLNGERYKFIKQ